MRTTRAGGKRAVCTIGRINYPADIFQRDSLRCFSRGRGGRCCRCSCGLRRCRCLWAVAAGKAATVAASVAGKLMSAAVAPAASCWLATSAGSVAKACMLFVSCAVSCAWAASPYPVPGFNIKTASASASSCFAFFLAGTPYSRTATCFIFINSSIIRRRTKKQHRFSHFDTPPPVFRLWCPAPSPHGKPQKGGLATHCFYFAPFQTKSHHTFSANTEKA